MVRHAPPMVEPVVAQVQVPPGMLGPEPVSFEVRCFAVADAGGVVLVDTGTPGSSEAIGAALAQVGAAWSDVTDVVLTHSHFDHTGGLTESAELASGATVWAGAQDAPEIPTVGGRAVRPLAESDRVGKPGETKELTHTFAQAGETLAGCHVAGHYSGGMKAAITVIG